MADRVLLGYSHRENFMTMKISPAAILIGSATASQNAVSVREINEECDPQWKPVRASRTRIWAILKKKYLTKRARSGTRIPEKASERCSNACEYAQIECIIACENEPECLSNCSRETVACLNQCPCHTGTLPHSRQPERDHQSSDKLC